VANPDSGIGCIGSCETADGSANSSDWLSGDGKNPRSPRRVIFSYCPDIGAQAGVSNFNPLGGLTDEFVPLH